MPTGLPPPQGPLSARWIAGGVCLTLLGALSISISAGAEETTSWTVGFVAGGAVAIACGVLVLLGRQWAWLPSLVMFAAFVIAVLVWTTQVWDEPPGSDVEDMRPIVAMGGLMWAAAIMAPLGVLASCPRPRRKVRAGWRTDPQDGSRVRYWDGASWTTHTLPMRSAATVAAGWYPDPDSSERLRYWDGWCWTSYLTPRAPLPPAPGLASEPDPR